MAMNIRESESTASSLQQHQNKTWTNHVITEEKWICSFKKS
jgi:hypothetical protein